MWKIDLTYRNDFQTTFDRLFEKLLALQKSRPLPQVALQKLKEALSIEWTYNSNSIEGNTLSLRETQLVLKEGITIKGKSLNEHFEAKNHETALNYLYELVSDDYEINSKDILNLHQLVLRSIEDDFAGRLRTGGVRILGANFVPPNALKVPQLLDELIDFVNTNPLQLNTLELATVFHHKFVWIHPFFDGNGRTVRLCMNMILMKAGFPPAIILTNDRKKYYEEKKAISIMKPLLTF
jgi:Fic family protein